MEERASYGAPLR